MTKKMVLLVLIFMSSCASAFASASVWAVRAGGNVTYIGGTCHLLRQSDHPLPAEYTTAYRASDLLVFETQLAQMQTAEFQQNLTLLFSAVFFPDYSQLIPIILPSIKSRN